MCWGASPPAGGYYTFSNVPDGDYIIYVDIPGMERECVLTAHINSATGDTLVLALNYRADSTKIFCDTIATPVTPAPNITLGDAFTIFPNPFSESATIEYEVATDAEVKLDVYDVLGKRVLALADANQTAGKYKYTLNGDNTKLSAGIYFVTLNIAGNKRTQRAVMMR